MTDIFLNGWLCERWPAVIAGGMREMDDGAERVQAAVVSEAQQYRATGAYIAGVKTMKIPGRHGYGRNVTDRLIYNDDPSALPNEYGFMTRAGRVRPRHIFGHAMQRVG